VTESKVAFNNILSNGLTDFLPRPIYPSAFSTCTNGYISQI